MTLQTILAPALALSLLLTPQTTTSSVTETRPDDRPVDIAICLDTSGSMNGLIDAARQNIWAIINDLAMATPIPRLRVALLTFGNTGNDSAKGWVSIETPFTDDLDLVSLKLFALTTNGGDEYVGRVLQSAVGELEWSPRQDALKLIVVAGNESAEQDPQVDFRAICSQAIGQGIVVNSIYCGNPVDQIAPAWREVATRADGQFASIDKDNGTIVIETPFDAQLSTLSASLNDTYIPYGARGVEAWANQKAQDSNAAGLNSAAAAQRAFCKSTSNYSNGVWDLVDAMKNEKFELDKVKPEDMPEAMRKMTLEQRRAHVATMGKKRAEIQQQIAGLHVKREAFVQAEMKRRAVDGEAAFEFAVRKAVKAQAEAKGFVFRSPTGATTADSAVSGNESGK